MPKRAHVCCILHELPGLFSAISVVGIFQLNLMEYKLEISVNFDTIALNETGRVRTLG
jgi:hypothetical protein